MSGGRPRGNRRHIPAAENFLGITLSTARVLGNPPRSRRIVEKTYGIGPLTLWLSTEIGSIRQNFLLLRRHERSTIQSRDGGPQGSRSRKRRKPSGDRRLSRRAGPSGPDRRRNGQAASAVEVGSRGAFGRAGSREAGLRERGTVGQPARASPRSGPSGRDHVGSPSGQARREGVRGLFGAKLGRPRRSTWRLLCVWASGKVSGAAAFGRHPIATTPKQNPAAPECSRVCCVRACPRLTHLCGASIVATGKFVNKILWLCEKIFKIL